MSEPFHYFSHIEPLPGGRLLIGHIGAAVALKGGSLLIANRSSKRPPEHLIRRGFLDEVRFSPSMDGTRIRHSMAFFAFSHTGFMAGLAGENTP